MKTRGAGIPSGARCAHHRGRREKKQWRGGGSPPPTAPKPRLVLGGVGDGKKCVSTSKGKNCTSKERKKEKKEKFVREGNKIIRDKIGRKDTT